MWKDRVQIQVVNGSGVLLESYSAGACCTLQLPLRTDPTACSMHCLLARPQRGTTSSRRCRWVIWTMTTENMLHESSAKRSAGVASSRYGSATFQVLSTWMLYSCEASSGLRGSWHGDSTGPMCGYHMSRSWLGCRRSDALPTTSWHRQVGKISFALCTVNQCSPHGQLQQTTGCSLLPPGIHLCTDTASSPLCPASRPQSWAAVCSRPRPQALCPSP